MYVYVHAYVHAYLLWITLKVIDKLSERKLEPPAT